LFGGGGFVRLTGATGHAHIIRRQIGRYVLFDQYNGAYSKENLTAQGGAHGERGARAYNGGLGHRRTGTPTFMTGGTVPPLFKTQVKNLLSSETIYGDKITLKPFSARARPLQSPLGRSSHLVSQGQL